MIATPQSPSPDLRRRVLECLRGGAPVELTAPDQETVITTPARTYRIPSVRPPIRYELRYDIDTIPDTAKFVRGLVRNYGGAYIMQIADHLDRILAGEQVEPIKVDSMGPVREELTSIMFQFQNLRMHQARDVIRDWRTRKPKEVQYYVAQGRMTDHTVLKHIKHLDTVATFVVYTTN